jgi:hypothetical protein
MGILSGAWAPLSLYWRGFQTPYNHRHGRTPAWNARDRHGHGSIRQNSLRSGGGVLHNKTGWVVMSEEFEQKNVMKVAMIIAGVVFVLGIVGLVSNLG